MIRELFATNFNYIQSLYPQCLTNQYSLFQPIEYYYILYIDLTLILYSKYWISVWKYMSTTKHIPYEQAEVLRHPKTNAQEKSND